MKRSSILQMADDGKYTTYPSYRPYGSYDPYDAAVDEAGAKMDLQKRRHEMKIAVAEDEPRAKAYGTYE
jgi:hypothetical protein